MTDKPLVTVIIPTYNRASLIRNALESALGQTWPNKQIIVVDDGSTDNTADILSSYEGIEYVSRPNGGQAAARSTGLEQARGVYIASLDSDDTWEPLFLESCVGTMEEMALDFIFANWNQQSGDGRMVDYFSEFPYLQPYLKGYLSSYREGKADAVVPFSYSDLRRLYIECCPSPSSSVVIRRSSFVSGWNARMHIADDWCLLLDIILSKEAKAALILEKLWHKHINGDNIYDSRDHYEVLKLMYVEDTYEMLDRYSGRLTKAEVRVAQERCLENTIRMVKHSLYTRSHIGESWRTMIRGLRLNPLLFLRIGWQGLGQHRRKLSRSGGAGGILGRKDNDAAVD